MVNVTIYRSTMDPMGYAGEVIDKSDFKRTSPSDWRESLHLLVDPPGNDVPSSTTAFPW